MRRVLPFITALALAPGCLVLSVNPVYDAESLGWEPALLGVWQDADDKSSMQIDREPKTFYVRGRLKGANPPC